MEEIDVAGQRVCYLHAGPVDGPVVLLLHGLASDSGTWEPDLEPLAARGIRVIAPDLFGHGNSHKPATGYSLAGFSRWLERLLDTLGVKRATVVGHSLGGAIAMYFAHHHTGYTERLVLVSAGGLGKRVHPMLRAATLPGAPIILRALVNRRTAILYRHPRLHRTLRIPPGTVVNLARAGRSIGHPAGRAAFFATLHSVIQPSGQRGSMIEADYLAQHTPTLILWTEDDHVIPVSHAHDTHAHLPGSRLELFPGSSHELHRRFPDRFAEVIADFVETTEPAPAD